MPCDDSLDPLLRDLDQMHCELAELEARVARIAEAADAAAPGRGGVAAMQLSTRGRYAVMAMVDLATRQTLGCECGPICLAEIAARQKLSQAYLEQLFGKLRRAGLVASARGPGGGYRLARASDTIAIADIIAAVDEPIRATRCEDGGPGCLEGARLHRDGPAARPTICGTSSAGRSSISCAGSRWPTWWPAGCSAAQCSLPTRPTQRLAAE